MSDYDPTDFVDNDFQARKAAQGKSAVAGIPSPAPTLAEVGSRLAEIQKELADSIRRKEEKERERAALEETRRRQMEFQTGRQELIQNLTRGLGLLEEAEFGARRDAEQMARSLADLRDGLAKVQAIHEETWTKDNFSVELTRALTAVENARMEWNGARLKFPVLSGQTPGQEAASAREPAAEPPLSSLGLGQLCKLGLALTWPLALVALAALAALVIFLARHY